MATVYAEVNHDRWIVQCAACNSASLTEPKRSEYVCEDCHARYDVVWPDDSDAIIAVLALRPDRATRSWVHGEDVADLVGENVAHGVESH